MNGGGLAYCVSKGDRRFCLATMVVMRVMTLEGHTKSMIFVLFERAYSDVLLEINNNLGSIFHRF